MRFCRFGLVVLCLSILVWPASRLQAQRRQSIISPEVHRDRRVTFRLRAPQAKLVAVNAGFAQGNQPMKKDGNGIWTKTVMLFPGKYEYKFLVDGEWKEEPQNDQKCLNSFGTLNNIFKLPSSSSVEPLRP